MIQIIDDFYINSDGIVLKNNKPVPVLKDKDGYKLVYIYINNKRWQRGLAKLVATYLVKNPFSYKYTRFLDGNKLNCHPSNIVWISNKQDAEKRKIYECWQGKKKEFSQEYAIEKSKCPILKEYYRTGNISIVHKYVEEIYKSVRFDVQISMGWTYVYLVDRLERNSLFDDIKGYFLRLYKHFKNNELSNKTMMVLTEEFKIEKINNTHHLAGINKMVSKKIKTKNEIF
jgi:hypothetical protein